MNKAALQAAVDLYQTTEQGNYTDASWTAFQAALKAAQDVLADEDAAQTDVDKARGRSERRV